MKQHFENGDRVLCRKGCNDADVKGLVIKEDWNSPDHYHIDLDGYRGTIVMPYIRLRWLGPKDLPFIDGQIKDVVIMELERHQDDRGSLIELFRRDVFASKLHRPVPVMAYVSVTLPGVKRGPHEHATQTDYFCFVGPSVFRLTLWDYRPDSSTFLNKTKIYGGTGIPTAVIVPPGVVHAYENVGEVPGHVFNAADQLYGGENKQWPVDEIRHEQSPNNPFKVD